MTQGDSHDFQLNDFSENSVKQLLILDSAQSGAHEEIVVKIIIKFHTPDSLSNIL